MSNAFFYDLCDWIFDGKIIADWIEKRKLNESFRVRCQCVACRRRRRRLRRFVCQTLNRLWQFVESVAASQSISHDPLLTTQSSVRVNAFGMEFSINCEWIVSHHKWHFGKCCHSIQNWMSSTVAWTDGNGDIFTISTKGHNSNNCNRFWDSLFFFPWKNFSLPFHENGKFFYCVLHFVNFEMHLVHSQWP